MAWCALPLLFIAAAAYMQYKGDGRSDKLTIAILCAVVGLAAILLS